METRTSEFYRSKWTGLLLALVLHCVLPSLGQIQQRFDKIPELAQSVIHCIAQDQTGFIWIGTRQGLYRYDGHEVVRFQHDGERDHSLTSDWISALHLDRDGVLWVGTGGGGLNRYLGEGRFEHYQHNPGNLRSLSHNQVHVIHEDSQGELWVGTDQGLNRLDKETGDFRRFTPDKDAARRVRALVTDSGGRLLAGTDAGLYQWEGGALKPLTHEVEQAGVKALYLQKDGALWVGTDDGLFRYDGEEGEWSLFKFLPDVAGSISHDRIRALSEDGKGRLWVATFGGGVNRFNPLTRRFTAYVTEAGNPYSISDNRGYSLFRDRTGVMWIGTNQGINRWDAGRERFSHYSLGHKGILALEEGDGSYWVGTDDGLLLLDEDLELIRHYRSQRNVPDSLSHSEVNALHRDSRGRLWVGTQGGLDLYVEEKDHFRRYSDNERGQDRVSALISDSDGHLWVGAEDGGLSRFDGETFTRFQHDPGDPFSLSHQEVTALLQDRAGVFWVGTWSGLNRREMSSNRFIRHYHKPGQADSLSDDRVLSLAEGRDGVLWVGTWRGLNRLDRETERVARFGGEAGLQGEMVVAVLADRDQALWVSTDRGLSRFDTALETFTNYDVFDGLQDHEFYGGSALKSSTGFFFFGGPNGFNMFHPNHVNRDPAPPVTVITRLEVFNKDARLPHDEVQNLTTRETRFKDLNYKENAVTFQYAALHFASPEKNRFAYQLVGFDHEWVYTDERRASFSHLNPGLYEFRVKSSNKDGVWSQDPALVPLRIRQPPWLGWPALTIYFMVVVAVALMYRRFHRKQLIYERTVNERLKALDRQKDEFLANTSHELRTPLHGIIGLAESLREGASGPLTPQLSEDLEMIISSGQRLSCLVDDILDFSKLVGDQLELHKENVDIRVTVDMVLKLITPLLGEKGVSLLNNIPDDLPPVEADQNRLHQVLYNLIGNAVKFTDRGHIEVRARLEDGMVLVSVADTGIGIPDEEIERIFRSFTQVDGSARRIHGGTGLGLAITRQLVNLQGGKMTVTSNLGEGSVFTFSLPPAREGVKMFRNRVEPLDAPESGTMEAAPLETRPPELSLPAPVQTQAHILIVDDEPINRQVLKNYLALEHYHLTDASGGQEALGLMKAAAFDLVLLDVMMPRMSGYQVCAQIRKDYSLRELPVIFLTARNQEQDLIEGFQYGANDYLTKPIGKSELLSRVRTHLELRTLNRVLEDKVAERTRDLKLANTRLHSRNLELEALNHIAKTVNREVALEQVVAALLKHAATLFDQVVRGFFLLADSDADFFRVEVMEGCDSREIKTGRIEGAALRDAYLGVMEQPLEGVFAIKEDHCPTFHPSQTIPGDVMAVAIPFRDHLLGVLILESDESAIFTQSGVEKLGRFREHAVTAVSRARIFEALMEAQKELVDEAHQAGMAEIAATVLHNLGNTLNHVKTSVHGIETGVKSEKTIKLLERLAGLIKDHHHDLSDFFSDEARARQFQQALERISERLNQRTEMLQEEVAKISESLEEVVAVLYEQHKRARAKRPMEATDINRLLREVVHRGDCLFNSKLMEVEENFQPLPLVQVERPKLMHVLSYLLNNAREAIAEKGGPGQGRIRLSTERTANGIVVTINDNGVGIDPKLLSQVFVHGFTTKVDHQGFGLHYCANTLKEMACTIKVDSKGLNEGTRVSIFLPTRSSQS